MLLCYFVRWFRPPCRVLMHLLPLLVKVNGSDGAIFFYFRLTPAGRSSRPVVINLCYGFEYYMFCISDIFCNFAISYISTKVLETCLKLEMNIICLHLILLGGFVPPCRVLMHLLPLLV